MKNPLKHYLYSLLQGIWLMLVFSSCQGPSEAEEIVRKAINQHGGEQYAHALVSFKFRDRYYRARMNHGQFLYESVFQDSTGNDVHDSLNNEGYTRIVNGQQANLTEKDSIAYANSLNSVIYFALLPYFLNDPSVNKELLGTDSIKGAPYYEVKVTFDEEEGGKDFQDEFVYWIHQEDFTMDYFAYQYHTDGGGTRFREAYNTRGVNGIRFADYINYEATIEDFALHDYDSLFEAGQVKEFSRINLENIKVEDIDNHNNAQTAELL